MTKITDPRYRERPRRSIKKPGNKIAILRQRDGDHCFYCKRAFEPGRWGRHVLTLDHKIPWSHGGSNKISNLVLAHYVCNRTRASIDWKIFKEEVEAKLAWNFPLQFTREELDKMRKRSGNMPGKPTHPDIIYL